MIFLKSNCSSICLTALLSILIACKGNNKLIEKEHAIVGEWIYETPSTNCIESYKFFDDGTALITSKSERVHSSYTISSEPNAAGVFLLSHEHIRTNGKVDCFGNVSELIKQYTTYVKIDVPAGLLYACFTDLLDNCIGPMKKLSAK